MRYFDRTSKLANILIGSSILLFVLTIFLLFKGSIVSVPFLLSAFALIVGIACKCIVKDAKEELDAIKQEYDKKIK